MLGILLALTAAVAWAAGAIFARLSLMHLRSSTGTIISLIVGVAVVMSLAMIFLRDYVWELSGTIFLWFVVAGVLQTLLGRFLNYSSVQRIGVSRALPIIGAAPLFATLFAVVFTGEQMTLPLLAGTIAIIGGVALIVSSQ